ncbi:MAG: hypothetical protein AAF202_02680 [Pseudomonadota bacterium]
MKKLILSRKGFDSSPQGGGGPSPILPDGSLLSLPIPSADKEKYSDLSHSRYGSYQKILNQLSLKPGRRRCHLDPDLTRGSMKRMSGWRPSLGQAGAAQSHLVRTGVGAGDLFLVFGWFRHTQLSQEGRLMWSRDRREDLHILFGYLEVDRVIWPHRDKVPTWLEEHPHVLGKRSLSQLNAIYLAKKKSDLFQGEPGSKTFDFSEDRVLTQKGKTRSWWVLPKSVFGKVEITYHKNAWKPEGFRCVGRGQEFVMPLTEPIQNWVEKRVQ